MESVDGNRIGNGVILEKVKSMKCSFPVHSIISFPSPLSRIVTCSHDMGLCIGLRIWNEDYKCISIVKEETLVNHMISWRLEKGSFIICNKDGKLRCYTMIKDDPYYELLEDFSSIIQNSQPKKNIGGKIIINRLLKLSNDQFLAIPDGSSGGEIELLIISFKRKKLIRKLRKMRIGETTKPISSKRFGNSLYINSSNRTKSIFLHNYHRNETRVELRRNKKKEVEETILCMTSFIPITISNNISVYEILVCCVSKSRKIYFYIINSRTPKKCKHSELLLKQINVVDPVFSCFHILSGGGIHKSSVGYLCIGDEKGLFSIYDLACGKAFPKILETSIHEESITDFKIHKSICFAKKKKKKKNKKKKKDKDDDDLIVANPDEKFQFLSCSNDKLVSIYEVKIFHGISSSDSLSSSSEIENNKSKKKKTQSSACVLVNPFERILKRNLEKIKDDHNISQSTSSSSSSDDEEEEGEEEGEEKDFPRLRLDDNEEIENNIKIEEDDDGDDEKVERKKKEKMKDYYKEFEGENNECTIQ